MALIFTSDVNWILDCGTTVSMYFDFNYIVKIRPPYKKYFQTANRALMEVQSSRTIKFGVFELETAYLLLL